MFLVASQAVFNIKVECPTSPKADGDRIGRIEPPRCCQSRPTEPSCSYTHVCVQGDVNARLGASLSAGLTLSVAQGDVNGA